MGRKCRKKRAHPGESSGSDAGTRGKTKKGPSTENSKTPEAPRHPLAEWASSLVIAFFLFLFLRTFVIHTFVIISGSMEGTLLIGDLMLVNRAAVGAKVPGTSWRVPGYADLRRGDIVVFDPHHDAELKLVKRIMGLPGDTLEMRNKVLIVNGRPLDEPYVRHTDLRDQVMEAAEWRADARTSPRLAGDPPATRDQWGPLVVPPGHYFMMGDNRDESLDSRYWGFLEAHRIEGRAGLVYFSYERDSMEPFPWLREIRWNRLGDRVR